MRNRILPIFAVAAVFLASSAWAGVKLAAIRFPMDMAGETGPKTPPGGPTYAPLSQRVVFEFDGQPVIGAGIADGLRIRIAPGNGSGQPAGELAYGTYKVSGDKVIWTPRLPTAPLPAGFGPGTDVSLDASLPGLRPDTIYRIEVTVGTPNSVKNLTGIQSALVLPLDFRTTAGVSGPFQVASFYSNAPSSPPKASKDKTKPKPGITGLHPNLFEDPAGLFTATPQKKRPPFKVQFKGPLDPSADNISIGRFRLRAVIDPEGTAVDLRLGATPVLTENAPKKAVVVMTPEGILPLGHTVALEFSDKLRSISGQSKDPDPTNPEEFVEIARFEVAKDPLPGTPVDDLLLEDFDTNERQDTTIAAAGDALASWDALDSDVLKANFGFGGDGSLGRFVAPDENITITLDTDFQVLPLFSGATPDVPPGTVVKGGVFHFTEFHLPPNATLKAQGTNPLVITATEDALIEGKIDLNGQEGTGDNTFDSAISPSPGGSPGPGGGRGGDSHPVIIPQGATSLKFIMSPQFGQSGFAPGNKIPGGGGGGQCGCTLPWTAFATNICSQFDGGGDGSRGSGGGGGSFNVFLPQAPEDPGIFVSGRRGAVGMGNHLPVVFDPTQPLAGTYNTPTEPLAYDAQPGNPTNAVAMKNPNPTFKEAYNLGMIYDNGPTFFPDFTSTWDSPSSWPNTKHITLFGNAGPMVFVDPDPNNNFIGAGGELSQVIGGQGGGGAGSRTEGPSLICKQIIFDQAGLPFTVLDAKGGGGGGAAGGLLMQVLGTLTFKGSKAKIEAKGGNGGGGEQTEGSNRGGAAGGGSGGCVVLQSAIAVLMNDALLPATVIDVSGGCGKDATTLSSSVGTGAAGGETKTLQFADGGPGGPGLVQIHAPDTIQVVTSKIDANIHLSVFDTVCTATGFDPFDPLVDMSKTPTPLTSVSKARSTWYDLGAVTGTFRPPVATAAGSLPGPIFGIPGVGPFFKGTSPQTGLVLTDVSGNVLDPFNNDLDVDAPDLLLDNFIPSGPTWFQTVTIRFQGADEDPANPGTPDLSTATPFVTDATQLNGRRFVRWEVAFDIASDNGAPSPFAPHPQMNFLRLPFKF